MKHERIFLRNRTAWLDTYFQGSSLELKISALRPCILICPGGGYQMTSDREAEPIALAFAARGFHTAVLRYPVFPTFYPEALLSLAEALVWLRSHGPENHIHTEQITVCGFSAGGHLAASLGVFWQKPFLTQELGVDNAVFRPNRLLLSYPVITGGAYAHHNSIDHLLGKDADEKARQAVSLEQHVNSFVPPTFIWHTYEDQIVPVENTLLFVTALRKKGVPFELHLYSQGEHGLALANEVTATPDGGSVCHCCEGWVELACNWLNRPIKAYVKR